MPQAQAVTQVASTISIDPNSPLCPLCGSFMVARNGTMRAVVAGFWGCMAYPDCKGIVKFSAAKAQFEKERLRKLAVPYTPLRPPLAGKPDEVRSLPTSVGTDGFVIKTCTACEEPKSAREFQRLRNGKRYAVCKECHGSARREEIVRDEQQQAGDSAEAVRQASTVLVKRCSRCHCARLYPEFIRKNQVGTQRVCKTCNQCYSQRWARPVGRRTVGTQELQNMKPHNISKEGRERISAAQKERWKKVREEADTSLPTPTQHKAAATINVMTLSQKQKDELLCRLTGGVVSTSFQVCALISRMKQSVLTSTNRLGVFLVLAAHSTATVGFLQRELGVPTSSLRFYLEKPLKDGLVVSVNHTPPLYEDTEYAITPAGARSLAEYCQLCADAFAAAGVSTATQPN